LLLSTQITGACLSAGQHHLAIAGSHTLSYSLSIFVVGRGSSLQAIIDVFAYIFWTCAYCVSGWRANQGGQYKVAE